MLMMRPRMCDGASSCSRVFAVVWKMMLNTPSPTTTGIANHQLLANPSANSKTGETTRSDKQPRECGALPVCDQYRPRNYKPTPIAEVSRPKPPGPECSGYFATSGSMTVKL